MASAPIPTLRDVAAAAGVAISTVSDALNGKGRVDVATRQRVRETADRLGYSANRAARSLRSGRTATLGLLLPVSGEFATSEYLGFDWYGRIAMAAARAALRVEYSLLLLPEMRDPALLQRINIDGAIVVDPMASDPRLPMIKKIGLPAVSIGPDPRDLLGSAVCPDLELSTQEMLTHLVANGASRILLLLADPDSEWTRIVTGYFSSWCGDRGVTGQICRLDTPSGDRGQLVDEVYARMHAELSAPERPDAVYSVLLGCAPIVASVARDLELAVPGDLLIAQDVDEPALLTTSPPITAFEYFPEQQAHTAVSVLLDLINGNPAPVSSFTPGRLNQRASTSKVLAVAENVAADRDH